jgi:SHS family lactate transporter-like MFS transporter
MSVEHKNDHYPSSPTQHSEEDHHHVNTASIKEQLATWHVGRGDKSFARAMIPTTYTPPSSEERVTKNPFKLLGMLDRTAWLLFFSGWYVVPSILYVKADQCRFAWTCDGYDYFAVPLTVTSLATAFGVTTPDITTSITLTLLFRSVGAVIFGVLADRYGRKWTYVLLGSNQPMLS